MNKAPWIICPVCYGEGRSSAHLGIIDPNEWDEEQFEDYMAGAYDKQCSVCKGSGKVREDYQKTDGPIIMRGGVIYRDADDAAEHWLRSIGG